MLVAVGMRQRLIEKWHQLIHEVAKFGTVGAINTVVDFAIFNWLVHRGIGPLTSQAISATVSISSSYLMNRYWTFKNHERTNVRREYILYFLLNAVGLLIIEACIAVAHYGLHLNGSLWLNVAKVVGVAVSMWFRYWSYKKWVFLEAGDDEADLTGAAIADALPPHATR